MNMIQWEQSIQLNEKDLSLINSFDETDLNLQKPQMNQKVQQGDDFSQSSVIQELMSIKLNHKVQNEDPMIRINKMLVDYQKRNEVLQSLMANLVGISDQLNRLQDDRQKVVSGITAFHEESQLYIQQQKTMIEVQGLVQEYLQYYTSISRLQSDIENCTKVDSVQRSYFEQNIQRLLSEICDGLVFFDSKPQFHAQQKQCDIYRGLKRKLLAITKSHLFRVLNREFSFSNDGLTKMKSAEVLSLFYPFVAEVKSTSTRTDVAYAKPNETIFIPYLQIFFGGNKSPISPQLEEQYERLSSVQLRSFFTFLLGQVERDPEIHEVYDDVFKEFYSYCRINIHQTINEQIQKSLQNPNQLGNTLHKIRGQLLEQQSNIVRKKKFIVKKRELTEGEQQFLTELRKKQLKRSPDGIVFEAFMAFLFEVFFNESLYMRVIFSPNQKYIEDNIHNDLQKILAIYTYSIRQFISKISHLETLKEMAKFCINLQNILPLLLQRLTNPLENEQHFMVKTVMSLAHSTTQKSAYLNNFFSLFQRDFLDKLRYDLMQKIIQLSHAEIQEKVYAFNTKEFIKHSRRIIYKYGSNLVKDYTNQRSEIFPPVERGIKLILQLSEYTERNVFEQLAGEVLREVINMSRLVSDSFELRYDSYLFYLKQLLYMTDQLSPLGGSFVLKESELDFSGTKAMLISIIQGAVSPGEIRWVELTSADKLWSYTTNFFSFIYKGLPKINSYEVDVRANLLSQLTNTAFSFVKDMTFVIGKNVIDYLRKYAYLRHLLEEKPEQQAQRDLEILISRETITKTYTLFTESMYDFTDEMVAKLNNYVGIQLWAKFASYLEDIIQNCTQLLSAFYINVSRHHGGGDYDKFEFKSIEEVHRAMIKKIVFIE